MVENIKQSEFNKNVIQVYTQEANFTGYKGFDFTAIDDLEYLIRQQLIPYASGIKSSLDLGINTNQLDLNYITDNVSISGRALTYLSGIANEGVNVNQLDLNYITDNVSISGQALSYLSGMVNQGINVNQADLNYITDNVSISGQALSYLSGIAVNGIFIEPSRTNVISGYTISTSVGTAINGNSNRKELCVQNLSNNTLYVKYGSAANSSSFNFILSANSAVDAGDGGILTDQNYNGLVSVSGVSPRFIAWERT